MLLVVFLAELGLISGGLATAQVAHPPAGTRPDRIVSARYKFSVIFPKGWFVFEGGDVPVFFNFTPDKSLQGELPPGGASLSLLVREDAKDGLSSWADREIKIERGVNVERKDIAGPDVAGTSRALQVSFDKPALGRLGQSLHFVIIFWPFGNRLFGAKLSYIVGEAKGGQFERVLFDVLNSFRPIE